MRPTCLILALGLWPLAATAAPVTFVNECRNTVWVLVQAADGTKTSVTILPEHSEEIEHDWEGAAGGCWSVRGRISDCWNDIRPGGADSYVFTQRECDRKLMQRGR
jgi:hypothetical protein